MDLKFIHNYLCNQSYWAKDRSMELVKKSLDHSLCFGVFQGNRQVGFGRVATDYVVFAWLMDLFVDPKYRGQGLGRFLVKEIIEHPELQQVNGIGLRTEDAHKLYADFGFEKISRPETWRFVKARNNTKNTLRSSLTIHLKKIDRFNNLVLFVGVIGFFVLSMKEFGKTISLSF